MQKKIIVLAVAAALAAPVMALADPANVTPYGVADLSFDRITTGDSTDMTTGAITKGTSKMVVSSNQSLFGLKGSEDLGDGLMALWQMETHLNADDGSGGSFGNRNTFVGLKGSAGTVLLGRHESPYKLATRSLDVFGNTLADNRSLMGWGLKVSGATVAMDTFDSRNSDAITYTSPTFGAFNVIVQRANTAETITTDTATKSDVLSLAAIYKQDAIYAALANETHNTKPNTGSSVKDKAMKLGVGYTQEKFSVGLVYEKVNGDAAIGDKHTAIYVGAKISAGSGKVKVAVTKQGEVDDSTDTGARQISLGYDHPMSKRTTAYVLYTKLSNQDGMLASLAGASSAGSTSSTNSISLSRAGADPSAISFGMRHVF